MQSFEEAFHQIKAATGIDNIDELVQTFIDAEDQNFSLFNYVNELNNEVEKLEEQIADIKVASAAPARSDPPLPLSLSLSLSRSLARSLSLSLLRALSLLSASVKRSVHARRARC